MSDSVNSLTERVTPLEAGAHVTAACFLGRTPALALGDVQILFADIGAERRIIAHSDAAILTTAKAGQKLVTGGDDGRIMSIAADGTTQEIAHEKGKWVDALAAR